MKKKENPNSTPQVDKSHSPRINYTSHLYAKSLRPDHLNISKINQILSPQKKEKLLEAGCSKGTLVKHYRNIGVDAYGIDANEESVILANSDFITHQTGEDLKFPENSFDALMGIHVIEHIPKLKKFLQEVYRVVKPGGRIFFMYPCEPIRGLYAVYAATLLFGNPLRARQIHCHKLTPKKLRKQFTDPANLEHVSSNFWFFPLPQFGTLLRKPDK